MFSYKRFTLNKKLAIIPVVAIVPMIVLAVYLLLTASYTTNAYADITNNVVQANKYVQDFKERVDYTMYLSVIKNKTIDEMQVGKVTVNGILTVNPYQYITELENVCDELGKSATVESNCEQIRRLKNTLGSLRNCVEELEKCINDRNSYDENMQYLDNNIYVLTSLVQSGIENYIYVETTNFENVKAQLNKKNKQDIWDCCYYSNYSSGGIDSFVYSGGAKCDRTDKKSLCHDKQSGRRGFYSEIEKSRIAGRDCCIGSEF